MVKIETFDGITFWKKAYAHQRGKLLKRVQVPDCLLYTSPSPRDLSTSRMPSSA